MTMGRMTGAARGALIPGKTYTDLPSDGSEPLDVLVYQALIRPMASDLVPVSNGAPGSRRATHAWDRSFSGEKFKNPGGLYVAKIVTHLDLDDWLAMHHYTLERFTSQRLASLGERTDIK